MAKRIKLLAKKLVDLREEIDEVETFFNSNSYENFTNRDKELNSLLEIELSIMRSYEVVLNRRLTLLEDDERRKWNDTRSGEHGTPDVVVGDNRYDFKTT
jgi:hypothetical protein